MFERMAEAEEEEKQRALGPGAKRRGASRCDEHERVDLEALELQILDRLANGEPAAEAIGRKIAGKAHPIGPKPQFFDAKAYAKDEAAEQREDELGSLAEDAAMVMALFAGFSMLVVGAMFVVPAMFVAGSMIVPVLAMSWIGLSRDGGRDGRSLLGDAHS